MKFCAQEMPRMQIFLDVMAICFKTMTLNISCSLGFQAPFKPFRQQGYNIKPVRKFKKNSPFLRHSE